MTDYIQVTDESTESPIELPLEDDGTLLLPTLQAQFPGASGISYRNPESGNLRGLRLVDNRFYPPAKSSDDMSADQLWEGHTYLVVFPKENKRKISDISEKSHLGFKTQRMEQRKCCDLVVLGTPWSITEDQLKSYFSKFGELQMAQVKKDKNGQGKGYAFIRFTNIQAQDNALMERHRIEDRVCEVKIPDSSMYRSKQHVLSNIEHFQNEYGMASWRRERISRKIFVGRITEDLTQTDLRDYFSQFGEVTDIFIPRPFRSFAFVTFADPRVASELLGEDHIIKNCSVHIWLADPKGTKQHPQMQMQNLSNTNPQQPSPSVPQNLSSFSQQLASLVAAANQSSSSQSNISPSFGVTSNSGMSSEYGTNIGESGHDIGGGMRPHHHPWGGTNNWGGTPPGVSQNQDVGNRGRITSQGGTAGGIPANVGPWRDIYDRLLGSGPSGGGGGGVPGNRGGGPMNNVHARMAGGSNYAGGGAIGNDIGVPGSGAYGGGSGWGGGDANQPVSGGSFNNQPSANFGGGAFGNQQSPNQYQATANDPQAQQALQQLAQMNPASVLAAAQALSNPNFNRLVNSFNQQAKDAPAGGPANVTSGAGGSAAAGDPTVSHSTATSIMSTEQPVVSSKTDAVMSGVTTSYGADTATWS